MDEGRVSYRIADIESSQRPRERLASAGASALSHAELLAILLGSGTMGLNAVQLGDKLLTDNHGLLGLQRLSYDELCDQRGPIRGFDGGFGNAGAQLHPQREASR